MNIYDKKVIVYTNVFLDRYRAGGDLNVTYSISEEKEGANALYGPDAVRLDLKPDPVFYRVVRVETIYGWVNGFTEAVEKVYADGEFQFSNRL